MSIPFPARACDAAQLPWLAGAATRALIWRDGRAIDLGAFAAQAEIVAAALPGPASAIINLCAGRYAFLLAFAAALRVGRPTLLLPARTPAALAEVRQAWPGALTLHEPGAAHDLGGLQMDALGSTAPARGTSARSMVLLDATRVALVGHTSGSSGAPQPQRKTLRALWASNAANQTRLAAELGPHFNILATVPPQHMYGIEMSVLLALLGGGAVADAQPLLPADVVAELRKLPAPRLLVTTPLHLRALLDAGLELPCEAIVSATAPLEPALARAAEAHTGAPLIEVYGSTETCVVATRRPAHEPLWTPYPGVDMQSAPDGVRIEAPQLFAPVLLGDLVERQSDGRFALVGRVSDLIEIAGKRASLGDLTRHLLAVPGVEDAAIIQHEDVDSSGVRRLAALVVAPGTSTAAIMAALRASFDPAFLPRPLKRVPRLPRNALGKLPRAALLDLLRG